MKRLTLCGLFLLALGVSGESIVSQFVRTGDSLSVAVQLAGKPTNLKYLLSDAPDGMSISSEGLINWAVGSEHDGNSYNVRVLAIDQDALLAVGRNFSVTVNHNPKWEAIGSQSVKEQNLLTFAPVAIDLDDTDLSLIASGLPAGASYDSNSGFTWTPGNGQIGVHDVGFTVTDPHGARDDLVIRITVKRNVAPTIQPLNLLLVSAGEYLEVQMIADDPDGNNTKLKYQLQNAPEEMTISAEGLIEWTVSTEEEGGTREVTVLVLDDLESSANVILSVTVNFAPPKLERIGPQNAQVGQALVIKPSATDPNNAELMFAAVDLPAGAVFDSRSGFSWTPTQEQLGVHQTLFAVTDPHGIRDEELVVVTVTEAVVEPALSLLSSRNVTGAFTHEEDAIIDEGNGTITVGVKEDIVFYQLRSSGKTKLKINRITVQGGKVAITYETVDE